MPRRMLIYDFTYNGVFALKRQMQNYLSSFFMHHHTSIHSLVLISDSDKKQIDLKESFRFSATEFPFMMQTPEVTHDFS